MDRVEPCGGLGPSSTLGRRTILLGVGSHSPVNCTSFENSREESLHRFESCTHRMQEKRILIGGAVVFKVIAGRPLWFVVKHVADSDWEIPKTTVRKTESSVRGVIRMTGEQGGMTARVIEEVGRSSTTTVINGKSLPQRFIYYLMVQKGGSEAIGYAASKWLEYGKAVRLLSPRRDQQMLLRARDLLKDLEKKRKVKIKS